MYCILRFSGNYLYVALLSMKASKLILGHRASKSSFLTKKKETNKIKIKKQKLFVTVRLGLFLMRVNNCSCVQIDKEI